MEALSSDPSFEPIGILHKDLEVSDSSSCSKIAELKPEVVVNTAAFHKTDACEDNPLRAFQVNAVGSYNVSRVCSEIGAVYAYISTDYVFSGEKNQPYTEEDIPNPINVYGTSKLAGENVASVYAPKHYIIRSSSLFGRAGASGKGGNFVETMIRKASNKEEISVVDDIVMSPTSTSDLAAGIRMVIERHLPFGIYHIANAGSCSWWEFAKEITSMAGFDVTVSRANSALYPTKARRPRMSALSSAKLVDYGIAMSPWNDALRAYLQSKGYLHR
jgi:dTDP-4-dehydrorhamnose reductase